MMKPTRFSQYCAVSITLAAALLFTDQPAWAARNFTATLSARELHSLQSATPFQPNDGAIPSKAEYSGPLFTLNHAWPAPLPPLVNAPWQAAIHNGPITTRNAAAYAAALKAAVTANGRQLIERYDTWDAAKAGWYTEPWLGTKREAIRGTYPAGEFGPGIFPGTGLAVTFGTHVLTYYDARAASTLKAVWGTSAMSPTLTAASTQFAEGSIIVKAAAFASTDATRPSGWWTAMDGAQAWQLYVTPGTATAPKVWPAYVAQFDIIVKDTQSSPKTGWVFMTLVYDRDAPGDIWDKMVPLGVQWGNDPQATKATMPLVENWINPKAPLYSTQTLGWGGRLSGPNDGGRNDIAINGKPMRNVANSGCMSCHSTSQWNVAAHRMPTFLLPSFAQAGPPGFQTCGDDGRPDPNGLLICSPPVGSVAWLKWFQNRSGSTPMDAGAIATDFDEVLAFKSLPLWWAAVGKTDLKAQPDLLRLLPHQRRFNEYTGAPLRPAQ